MKDVKEIQNTSTEELVNLVNQKLREEFEDYSKTFCANSKGYILENAYSYLVMRDALYAFDAAMYADKTLSRDQIKILLYGEHPLKDAADKFFADTEALNEHWKHMALAVTAVADDLLSPAAEK